MMRFELKRLNLFKWGSPEGQRKKGRWIFLGGALLICLSFLIFFLHLFTQSIPPSKDSIGSIPSSTKESEIKRPLYKVIGGSVEKGGTFFKSLIEKNIPLRWIDLVVSKLTPHINFRKIKGGTFSLTTDENDELVEFIYEASPTEVYEIKKDPQGYAVQKKEIELQTYLVKVRGEISSSLFEAMDTIEEQDSLTITFAEILAWEIDFYKDVREGDRFKVVVEKVYKGKDFIRYGPIHAVEYQRGEKVIMGISFQGDFYNERGISLKKAFLKAPLRFNRISSRFSQARKHPILGGVRPHLGIDYAAPSGTPIWAVADGKVISCGWNDGFGKQITLRHRNGYSTSYGHLSGFAKGIRTGASVRQKQVIGYVGSTGLSTGPHLDYRLVKDKRFKNPLKESFPAGFPIEKGEMKAFQVRRDEMLTWLQGDSLYKKRME
jgi:murein DD-endopeptidase MepM/ murein hydrolase activator NlpD